MYGLRSSDGRLLRTARSHILADFADTRARISRKTIARGKPGCPGCTCGLTRVHFCSTPTHMGLRAQSAPGFPCALFEEGQRDCNNPGKNVPRECEVTPSHSFVIPGRRAAASYGAQ